MTDEEEQPPAPPTPWGAPTDTPPPGPSPPPDALGGPPPPPVIGPPAAPPPPAGPIWGGGPSAPGWSPPGQPAFPFPPTSQTYPTYPVYPGGPPRWYAVRGLGTTLAVVLWVSMGVYLAAALAAFRERTAFNDFLSDTGTLSELDSAEELADLLSGFSMLLQLAVGVLVIIWMWRAAKDLDALGRFRPSLGAGWAIGGWFIPLANFVLPCIVAVDLWKGSDARVPGGNLDWKRASVSPLVGVWWGSWVLANLIGFGFIVTQPEDELFMTRSEYLTQNGFQIASLLALAVAAPLCALFVRRVSARLDETLAAQHAAWRAAQTGRVGEPSPRQPLT